MKTLSEKEFNGLNIKAMFTEKVEQAKKELSPLMHKGDKTKCDKLSYSA